jgi:hypothetical protein
LREINHYGFAIAIANEDVELVEVPVYESRMRESDDEIHQLRVEFARRRNLVNLTPLGTRPMSGEDAMNRQQFFNPQRVSINEFHQNAVSGLVNWPWDRKLVFM